MRDRSLLHMTKLDDFAAFCCGERGYRREPPKGEYEVLRLRHGAGPVLVFHHRLGCDHVTVSSDRGHGLVDSYLAWCRRAREATEAKRREVMLGYDDACEADQLHREREERDDAEAQ